MEEALVTWRELRERLAAERARIAGEIRDYPTPIAGCDQQFNRLLELRSQLHQEWNRLQAAEKASQGASSSAGALAVFVQESAFLQQLLADG